MLRGFTSEYLSEDGIDFLKSEYKYSCIDKSPISKYIMQPFWNWAIKLVPRSVAPNMLTFIGFLCAIVYPCLVAVQDPSYRSLPAPSWMSIVGGICVFMYQLLDNLDGRQARRKPKDWNLLTEDDKRAMKVTSLGSPAGQCMDHSMDALSCNFVMVGVALALGAPPVQIIVIMFTTVVSFAVCNWEEYHTHSLYLGFINGPTEGLLLVSIIEIYSGIAGVDFFYNTVFGYKLVDILIYFLAVGSLLTSVVSIVNVYKYYKTAISFNTYTTFWSAFPSIFQTVSFPLFGSIFVIIQHNIFENGNIYENTALFCLAMAIPVSLAICDMIVCRVSGQYIPRASLLHYFNFIAYFIFIALQAFGFSVAKHTFAFLVGLVVFNLFMLVHFVVYVLKIMTRALNINVLTLTNDQKAFAAQF
ncbi:hypothetical protein PCE1_003892 [Barthelona sp. PCE]